MTTTKPKYKVNKFQATAKHSPLLRVEAEIEAINRGSTKVAFHYLNEEDYERNMNQGIGSEFEHYLNIQISTIAKMRDALLFNNCTGSLTDYNPFVNGRTSTFDNPGGDRNMNINKSQLREIYLKVVQANNSSVLSEEPKIDDTINGNTGGPEITFSPITLASLPLMKIELTRILYYAKLFDGKILPDTSIHFHISADMLGDTDTAFSQTLQNLAWFYFENDKFMESFSGRIDSGVDLVSLRYMLNDPLCELTKEALKRRFYEAKGLAIAELMSGGNITKKKNFHLGAAKSDDRIKGFLNLTVRDEYDTLEIRWFGSTLDPEVYMARYEFCFAIIALCKLSGIHGTMGCESLKSLVDMVADRKHIYPHLWNAFLQNSYTVALISENERTPVNTISYEDVIEKVIDYSIYDEPFVKKYSEPTLYEENTDETEVGRTQKIMALIQEPEKVEAEPTEEGSPKLENIEELGEVMPPVVPLVTYKYMCVLTGYKSNEINEFVLTVKDEYVQAIHYRDHDLNEEGSDYQLKEEYCHRCSCTIEADEDDGCPNSEYHEDQYYCDDCYEAILEEEDAEEEEEESPFAGLSAISSY